MSLVLAVFFGLAASGITSIIRAVVQEARPLWLLEKPLSCDLCMSWWSSLAVVLFWSLTEPVSPVAALLAVPASVAVALLSTKAANRLSS
jgi:hypothetical protein